jgi:post-segregation antitoxin (ccd killing protein)
MKQSRLNDTVSKTRTTLTLPTDSLKQAKQIARARKVNLSTVIAEALENGLRLHRAAQRSEQVLEAYRKAFSGFSQEEILLLDGFVLENTGKRR